MSRAIDEDLDLDEEARELLRQRRAAQRPRKAAWERARYQRRKLSAADVAHGEGDNSGDNSPPGFSDHPSAG